jgi:hypothetical protein
MHLGALIGVLTVAVGVGGMAVEASATPASGKTVVVKCAKQSLQKAINAAPAHATLLVSGTCHGQFTDSKSLTIKGNPKATLSGDAAGTVLNISSHPLVRLESVAVSSGRGVHGAGISARHGASLSLDHVNMNDDEATGVVEAEGGAIDMQGHGRLTVADSVFTGNVAVVDGAGSQQPQTAEGGAIWYSAAIVTITGSRFSGNLAAAASSDAATTAFGGAIAGQGRLTVTSTVFTANKVSARDSGSSNDVAGGGAVYVEQTSPSTVISTSTFADNGVLGQGIDIVDLSGGAVSVDPIGVSTLKVTDTRFTRTSLSATSSSQTASGQGGALFADVTSAELSGVRISKSVLSVSSTQNAASATGGGAELAGHGTVSDSAFTGSRLTVGGIQSNAGGGGAYLYGEKWAVHGTTFDSNVINAGATQDVRVDGGGVEMAGIGPRTMTTSTVSNNTATVARAALNGDVLGAGLAMEGDEHVHPDVVSDSTITGNVGTVNAMMTPVASGGGVLSDDLLDLRYDTIAGNRLSTTGGNTIDSFGGGVDAIDQSIRAPLVVGSIVTGNTAAGGPTCSDQGLISGGYNLFGSLTGCPVTTLGSDQVNAAARLGPLAANGGPTKTIALRAGSRALDRVPKAACLKVVKRDERGVKRPQGTRCDEGAYEKKR